MAAGALLALAPACADTSGEQPVRIGVTNAADAYWSTYQDIAAQNGVAVSFVSFADYVQPNIALQDGDIDMNQFQGLSFLAAYNKRTGANLTPIGSTAIYPLPLYSTRHKSIASIPKGGVVIIPNDPTSESRALQLLRTSGLVSLRDPKSIFVRKSDISPSSRVVVRTVDSFQTTAAMDTVDAAIATIHAAHAARLDARTILTQDDPTAASSLHYVSVFAVRNEDRLDPTLTKLAELFHHPIVLDAYVRSTGRDSAIVRLAAQELQTIESRLRSEVPA